MASPTTPNFVLSTPMEYVTWVQINRASKLNAFNESMWRELGSIFQELSRSPDVRAIVLSGVGDRAFTAGLDVQSTSQQGFLKPPEVGEKNIDTARKATEIRRYIEDFQDCVGSIEKCEKPVICVMHGISYGLAIDMATCADIRICARDTQMAVKEVDIGLAADIGTLSRLPKIVGNISWVKEVSLSARIFGAEEAYRVGFVSQVCETKEKAIEAALTMSGVMASKSPVAVQGTKHLLNHAKDHTVNDSLRYTAVWNSAAIQTNDVQQAMLSGLKKTKPRFEKL